MGEPSPKRARLADPQAAVATPSTRGRITLRGLTSGELPVSGSGSTHGSCILVGDQYCAWIPHVGFLGLKVVGVLLQSPKLLDLLESKLGNDCDVQVNDWGAANMQADILLIDGAASAAAFALATRSRVKLILSTARKRSTSSMFGWRLVSRERISHRSVGGVTEKFVDFSVHQPEDSVPLTVGAAMPPAVPRDASTILSLKEHAKFFRPRPELEVIEPLRCVNLGSLEKPIYHGRGLLPASLSRDTWVLTPFLFSPKANNEWGLRRLGATEILACLDCPDDWSKWLVSYGIDRTFLDQQPPMACFTTAAKRWVLGVFRNNGGGETSHESKKKHAANSEYENPVRRSKIERRRDQADDEAAKHDSVKRDQFKRRKINPSAEEDLCPSTTTPQTTRSPFLVISTPLQASSPTPLLSPSLDIPTPLHSTPLQVPNGTPLQASTPLRAISTPLQALPVRQKEKRKRPTTTNVSSLCEGPTTIVEEEVAKNETNLSHIISLFPGNESGFVTPEIATGRNGRGLDSVINDINSTGGKNLLDELEDAAKAIREQKAVKSDDAEIPLHLWEERLFTVTPKWGKQRIRFRNACQVLKNGMLRFWKNLVRRSLTHWMEEKYPEVSLEAPSTSNLVRQMPPHGRGFVRWRQFDSGRKLEQDSSSGFTGEISRRYMWNKGGLNAYTTWWKTRMKFASWDLIPGTDAVARAANATWFEWDEGSRPFHWRWPEFYQQVIRDGLKVHFVGNKPSFKRPQAETKCSKMREKMRKKLDKVRRRKYIAPGFVSSLTSFFAVPKGLDDIRMVYDASVSGLNDSIWVPRFPLPTIRTHLRAVEEGTYMADLDVGEMFLNFILHSELRALCGVDLTKYGDLAQGEFGTATWEVWQRAAMGLKPSPYQAVQGMMVAEELIKGDPEDNSNPFRWDEVRMNLPGSSSFNPALPWVSKIRWDDDHIACDIVIFVDDLRVTGPTKDECWKAGQRGAQILNHLGLQDAPRKRRNSSQAPGPWSGSILRTDLAGVFLFVSQEKWDKAKAQIDEIIRMVELDPSKLDRKRLEQVRGFLQYVTQTYSGMTPYIIGFHLTIDGWRNNRLVSGWRMKEKSKAKPMKTIDSGTSEELLQIETALGQTRDDLGLSSDATDPPKLVSAVPRFLPDLQALRLLLSGESPPLKRARCSKMATVVYSFVDASGRGFGSTFQVGNKVFFQYGQWPERISETMSSNWRELANLVESLESEVSDRALSDCEIFLFTDNTTAEAAYWKGTSKSERLFDLVLRLRLLEIHHDLIIHVIHVAGTRMQAQGTDGISRGDKSMGVMRGIPMEEFVPLHKSAFERSPNLQAWLTAATKLLKPVFLSPKDWFLQGQGSGNFIWSPAPAAADVVVEQLGKARHKRPTSLHLIIAPRLMTGRWRRHMTRESDFYFKIPAGACSLWDAAQHEPVLIFVCLPFTIARPNFKVRQRLLEDFHRFMLEPGLWQGGGKRGGAVLCKLLIRARALCSL